MARGEGFNNQRECGLREVLSNILQENLKSPELWDVRGLAEEWPAGVDSAILEGSKVHLWQGLQEGPNLTLEFGSGRAAYSFVQAARELAAVRGREEIFEGPGGLAPGL